jgi:CO/xanthine dehydrogenase Mo-binding subunit
MASLVERPFPRADGPAKVTGQARYTADLSAPGLAVGRFLVAGRAHARIRRLDVRRARALPGVFAVITSSEVPARRYGSFGFIADRPLFATDLVRYEGEVVTAVAAVSDDVANEAVAAIEIEYEDLPLVLDVKRALEPASWRHSGQWR